MMGILEGGDLVDSKHPKTEGLLVVSRDAFQCLECHPDAVLDGCGLWLRVAIEVPEYLHGLHPEPIV